MSDSDEVRYHLIHINHDPSTGQEELIDVTTVRVPADKPLSAVLWDNDGWLDGIGDDPPVGRIEQAPEGYWTFPGEQHLRIYVQVDR